MTERTHHVSAEKKEIVKELKSKIKKAQIIGLVDMKDLPAGALLQMRKTLKGKVELFMTKRRLMRIAVEANKDIPGLDELFKKKIQMPAMLFTSENPFSLYKTIKKSKSPAAAKPGQLAPHDITIPKGPTPFSPGPVISEFAQLGIKAGVEDGKVAIKADAHVVSEGEPISGPLASMLARLNIRPMEIGLNLVAVLEKGVVYDKHVLDIDEKKFLADLQGAALGAINLGVDAGIFTKDISEIMIAKAFRGARAVALEGGYPAKDIIPDLLARGVAEAKSVADQANVETR